MKAQITSTGGDRECIDTCNDLDRKYVPALVKQYHLHAEADFDGLHWYVDLRDEQEISAFLIWCYLNLGHHKLIFGVLPDASFWIEIYDDYRE